MADEDQIARDFLRRMVQSYVTTAKVAQYLKRHHAAEIAADPTLASRVQGRVKGLRIP